MKLKKALSLVLTVAMLLGTLAIGVTAADSGFILIPTTISDYQSSGYRTDAGRVAFDEATAVPLRENFIRNSAQRGDMEWPDGADPTKYGLSSTNTYTISTPEELYYLAIFVNEREVTGHKVKYYVTKDIDMNDLGKVDPSLEGVAWTPIGNNTATSPSVVPDSLPYFRGYFDGMHHTISNLKVESSADGNANVGLFGVVRGAVVCNLVLDSSCSFTYEGTSTTARTGVVSVVASVGNDGNAADGGNDAGEYAVGTYGDGKAPVTVLIENVKNNAAVDGGVGFAGGIVGMAIGYTSYVPVIQSCESTGGVTGRVAGGILGAMNGKDNGRGIRVLGCKATGTISGVDYAGAIYNKLPVMGTVHINGWNNALGATVVTPGYNVNTTGYSYANVHKVDLTNIPHLDNYVQGNSYLYIDKPEDLVTIANNVANGVYAYPNTTIYLANDLDCSTLTDFKGIGSTSKYFFGSFDGQGYVIDNLKVTGTGLFATNTNAVNVVLRNIVLGSGCVIDATATASHAGGLIGIPFGNGGTGCTSILNCYSAATVKGADNKFAGGFVGWTEGNSGAMGTKIRNCTFAGTVISGAGTGSAGGFAGAAGRPMYIENSLFAGKLESAKTAYLIVDAGNSTLMNNVNQGDNALVASTNAAPVDLNNKAEAALIKYVGYQTKVEADDEISIRILAVLNDITCNAVGFDIVAESEDGNTYYGEYSTGDITTVYKSVLANENGVNTPVRAESMGGKYIVAITIQNVPANTLLVVTPWQDGAEAAEVEIIVK